MTFHVFCTYKCNAHPINNLGPKRYIFEHFALNNATRCRSHQRLSLWLFFGCLSMPFPGMFPTKILDHRNDFNLCSIFRTYIATTETLCLFNLARGNHVSFPVSSQINQIFRDSKRIRPTRPHNISRSKDLVYLFCFSSNKTTSDFWSLFSLPSTLEITRRPPTLFRNQQTPIQKRRSNIKPLECRVAVVLEYQRRLDFHDEVVVHSSYRSLFGGCVNIPSCDGWCYPSPYRPTHGFSDW